MGRAKKSGAAAPDEVRAVPEAELVEAVIEVYRNLDLGHMLRSMIEPAMEWTRAACGFGLGPGGDERRSFVPLASVLRDRDEPIKTLAGIEVSRVEQLLGDGRRIFEATGPFAPHDGTAVDPSRCSMAVPVTGPTGDWAGVLVLVYDGKPPPERVAPVDRFMEMTRDAVGNVLQVQSMRELVIKDDTASCFNRRHFEECMPEELARASRFRAPVSLIFLDMDNLKEVNSRYGHAMGSRTLLEVSVRVRAKIRKFDKLFRFGGDEFCIVLPETEWHGAVEVAERVRDSIASTPFLAREIGPGTGVPMTASLGIASFPLHARTQKDLIQLADRAMQGVKRSSKNGIGIAEIDGGERNDGVA